MSSLITDNPPWYEEIFEQNPCSLYDWDENIWETINNHRVILEMIPEQVYLSWGRPLSISPASSEQQKLEIWQYASHELIFTNNKLTDIKALPSPSKPDE